jgi:hypothetical protein
MRSRVLIASALTVLAWVWTARVVAHDRITTTITWEREIAPIVQTRCLSCHVDQGRAPMSLATYEAAKPWARAIRTQVLSRQMPKWGAARGYGEFLNDPSLSPFEIQLIVAWVDGGAPKALPVPVRPPGAASAGGPNVVATIRPNIPSVSQEVSIGCDGGALPVGRLVGLRPRLDAGGSVRVTAFLPDGRREILGWFRAFDPKFVTPYYLRTPLMLPSGSRLVTEVGASQTCSLTLSIG